MLQKNVYNKYDLYIVILLTSLAFGIWGGALQVVRLLAIFFAPIMLKHVITYKRYVKNLFLFFLFLLLYGVFSLLWSPDKIRGIEELIYYIVHFFVFFEILIFSLYAKFPIRSLSLGWMCAIIITLIVAIWEIMTDNHLPMSVQESELSLNTGVEIIQRRFASVTFGNYNAYVTFLCFALPFVFYGILSEKGLNLKKLTSIIVVLLSVVVILYNASRGGLICLIVMFIISLLTASNNKQKFRLLFFVAIMLGGLLYFIGENMLAAIIARSADGGLFEDSSRIYIWNVALKTFVDTLGLGTGLGGLQIWMERFAGGGINIPHNMLLEIFVQWGAIAGLMFVLFLLKLFWGLRYVKDMAVKRVLYMSLFSLPFVSVINSGYLLMPVIFVYFASMVVFFDYEHSRFSY